MKTFTKLVKKLVVIAIAFATLFAAMYFALYQSDKEDMVKTEYIKKEFIK